MPPASATARYFPAEGASETAVLHAQLVARGPVLALCESDCAILGLLNPALDAAGRLDDLRILHLAHPTRYARFTAASRRPAPEVFQPDTRRSLAEIAGDPRDEDGFEAVIWPLDAPRYPEGWENGGRAPPPGLSHLPEIGLREIVGPGRVTVVSCLHADRDAGAFFQRLSGLACGVADALRTLRPVLIRPGLYPLDDRRWRVAASRPRTTHSVRYPMELPVFGEPPAVAGPRASVSDGVASLVDGDRLILATEAAIAAVPNRPMRIYEIDRDGWCTGMAFQPVGADPRILADLVEGVRLRGMATVSDAWEEVCPGMGKPLCATAPLDEVAASGEALRALVEGHADTGPARGAGRSRDGQAALMLARGSRAKLDFLASWGVFADMLLDPAFADAVGSGARTLPLVAERIGVGTAIARRLVGRDAMPFGARNPDGTPDRRPMRDFLLALGHDALPAAGDAAGWRDFMRCCGHLRALARRMRMEAEPVGIFASLLVRSGPGDWAARLARMERWAKDGMRLADCGDFVRGVRQWLQYLYDDDPDDGDLLRVLTGEGGLTRFMEASLAWHSETELQAAFDLDPSPWPVPFGRVDLGDGWTARVLATNAELRAEGGKGTDADGLLGLDHCVGGYGTLCRRGDTLIVALRRTVDGKTERVSTADLAWADKGEWTMPRTDRRWFLRQHHGRGNRDPDPEAARRLERLREMLAGGGIEIDPAAFAVRMIDPSDLAAGHLRWAELVLPRYQRLFPAPWRDLPGAVFRDRLRVALGLPAIPRGAFMPRNEDFPC